jgi:hypothetical protein
MQYMLLIYSGTATDEYAKLSPEQQAAVSGEYFALSSEPNVTGGAQLQPPETATTVRTGNGSALTTDGPFAETKEALAATTSSRRTTWTLRSRSRSASRPPAWAVRWRCARSWSARTAGRAGLP